MLRHSTKVKHGLENGQWFTVSVYYGRDRIDHLYVFSRNETDAKSHALRHNPEWRKWKLKFTKIVFKVQRGKVK